MRKQAKRVASFRPSSLGWASTRGRCYAQSLHFKRNALQALTHIESTLGIEKPEDWHAVTLTDLIEIKDSGLPRKISKVKLAELLTRKYPDHNWEKVFLLKGRYAQQNRLAKAIALLFKDYDTKVNARKEGGLINVDTGDYLELDVYIPALNLAFEYQEKHHYVTTDYNFKPVELIASRDAAKKNLAASHGITLITVPCWWDGEVASLVATIKKARPGLLADVPSSGTEIPLTAPPHYFDKQILNVEGLGEPSTACFFTLSKIDPTGWWVFEKYDGVRGFWNPETKAFYSRYGNKFTMPQEIIDAMPQDIFLDGELWFGRDNFQEAMKIANRDIAHASWKDFKYMVFDMPKHEGTYEERFNALVEYFKGDRVCKYIGVATKQTCIDTAHLETTFQDIIDKGGEGVILRDPKAPHQPGRAPGYLKHKKFRDAEAKIVKAVGPYRWECELPNGIQFVAAAGTSEFARRWTPQPGDIVSFKHHGYLAASQRPKFPTLYRLRSDMTWDEVVSNWKEKKRPNSLQGVPSEKKAKRRLRKKGYWQDIENRRNHFIELAQEMGFDPFVAENWYKLNRRQFKAKQEGILGPFGSSLRKALLQTFPEVFQGKEWPTRTTVKKKPKWHWKSEANRRAFFEEYARSEGFDPTDIDRWSEVTQEQIIRKMGNGPLAAQAKGSLQGHLQSAFPELEFNPKERRTKVKTGHWSDIENRRKFFLEYASLKGFNPGLPVYWQNISKNDLLTRMGAGPIPLYNGSLKETLKHTFPELNIYPRISAEAANS